MLYNSKFMFNAQKLTRERNLFFKIQLAQIVSTKQAQLSFEPIIFKCLEMYKQNLFEHFLEQMQF